MAAMTGLKRGLLLVAILGGLAGCRREAVSPGPAHGPAERQEVPMNTGADYRRQGRIRPPAVAGAFYEGQPTALRRQVESLLSEARTPESDRAPLIAAVAPHAGYVYSGVCAATAYARLDRTGVRRVIILAPSHTRGFPGADLPPPDVTAYETPLGLVPIDQAVCARLEQTGAFGREPDINRREHSLEVHLPFLQVVLEEFTLVPILCGWMDEAAVDRAAAALAPLLTDGQTLAIASSDFTHYGASFDYLPFRDRIRERLYDYLGTAAGAVAALDLEGFRRHLDRTGDTICGRIPIEILMATLRTLPERPRGRVLSLYTSGDLTGDYRHCVSYAAIGFFRGGRPEAPSRRIVEKRSGQWTCGLNDEERHTLFAIARDTIEWAVRRPGGEFDWARYALTDRLREPRATFVTLKKAGHLRGCIGSLAPDAPLYQSVHQNAIQAALHDPRFPPVIPAELPHLHLDVSILSPIRDLPSWRDFRIGEQGIILIKGFHRAVYLPEVAIEQGWTVEETLSSLSEKAGLPPDAWKSGARFQVFESVVLAEE